MRAVIGLHHACVQVTSLQRSIDFYTRVFGLVVGNRLRMGVEDIVILEGSGGARVELIEDGEGERPTGVVDHLAFEVDELDSWVTRLREQGLTLLDDAPIQVPELRARIVFCLGPDGERIELFEQRQTQR